MGSGKNAENLSKRFFLVELIFSLHGLSFLRIFDVQSSTKSDYVLCRVWIWIAIETGYDYKYATAVKPERWEV